MNTFDIHLNELSNAASHEYENLKKHVEDVIVKIGVTNLYLDGKNKDFATCLATDAKKDLENVILLYEQARTELMSRKCDVTVSELTQAGMMKSINILNISAGTISASLAPRLPPAYAAIMQNTAFFHGILPALHNLKVASVVPMLALSLLVAIAACAGSPAIIYAGTEISPPPPATASTNPLKNTSGHTIK